MWTKPQTNKTCKVNFITQMCNRPYKWQLNPQVFEIVILLSSTDTQQGYPKGGTESQRSPQIHLAIYFSSSLTQSNIKVVMHKLTQ